MKRFVGCWSSYEYSLMEQANTEHSVMHNDTHNVDGLVKQIHCQSGTGNVSKVKKDGTKGYVYLWRI